MLSAADFPEVFPWMAGRPVHVLGSSTRPSMAKCIARWENDGGRTLRSSDVRRPANEPAVPHLEPDPWVLPLAACAIPALAIATMAIVAAACIAQLRWRDSGNATLLPLPQPTSQRSE